MPADDELTVAEAATLLGVSRWRVHQWIRDGRLPARKHGPLLWISRDALAALERQPPGRPRTTKGAPR